MDREEIRRGFCPLLGLLTSDAVEQCTAKGNLSFADLLAPYCSVNCTIKDPTGTSVSTRLMLDVRDLRRDGFLLSLTVLPSVLHEAVSSVASTSDTQLAFTTFAESLLQWAEPAEHELLRTYVACIFAVSSEDEDAMGELAKLVQMQHTQQHGGSSSPPIGPAHCVHPKWMLPNTLKYYVLVDDASSSNEAKTNEIFETMRTTYGTQNCHLLRLNSGESSELPDPWQSFIERKYRGLESGLDLARRNLLSRSSITTDGLDGTNSVSVCSVPSSNYAPRINNCILHPPPSHGQCWDSSSRERISALIEEMTSNALIPFVERQLRTLNEQIAARRGISKSLTTGVRKWFVSATGQPTSNNAVSYSMESNEMQMRRLADICFLFGLYSFAYQLYQTVKKEFDFDQATLYYAGALEMAAVSAFLGNPEMKAKQYPQDYMEKSLNYYAAICMRPILAMRAALISVSILSALELYTEAATQLLKLTSIENDLFCGVLLERASVMFGKAKMPRKMAFHYVLAGHRFYKSGQKALSLECYRRALPEYAHKNWHFAEDHILYTLAAECSTDQIAMEFCSRLIRTECLQHAEQQRQFLLHLLTLLSRNHLSNASPAVVPVPVVDGKRIRVIYGERPQEVLPELAAELNIQEDGMYLTWRDLEYAAFCSLFGSSNIFKPTPLVSDASTDNSKVRSTPPNERFRILIPMRNPLSVPFSLKRLRLAVKGDTSVFEQNVIEELNLEEECAWTEVEFYLRPWQSAVELHVTGIAFDLVFDEFSVPCQIPIKLRGPRLNRTAEHLTSVVYEADHRLDANVSPKSWPLLDIALSRTRHVNAFCGQIYRIECDVTNIGDIVVDSLCLATSRPELVSLSELNCDCSGSQTFWRMVDCSIPSTNHNILVFSPSFKTLKTGEKKRLRVELRAPAEEVKDFSVAFIFYYRGENGMVREQRHLISMDTRRLLQTSLRLVDASVGVCLLYTRNLISTRDSVLAKVELLRIRSIVSRWGNLTDGVEKPDIFVQPVRNRVGPFYAAQ